MTTDPFAIALPPTLPLHRAAAVAARPLLSAVLGLGDLGRLYRDLTTPSEHDDAPFEERVARRLDVSMVCSPEDLGHIPATGPVVIAANHPHGVLDGLVLAAAVRRVRPDVRLLVNYLLSRVPELHASCFFVDPFDGPEAAARSRAGLRAAHLWLRGGGALVVFPSGEVASSRDATGHPVDAPWRATVARLALQNRAAIVPAFIEGHNSRWFYAAGRVHPRLRTALLGRELIGQRGRQVPLRLGPPMASPRLDDRSSDANRPTDADRLTRDVRTAVDRLARAGGPTTADDAVGDEIARELDRLRPGARLVESGSFTVFCATADEIPATLREIGRLRALTFSAVGEGAGRALDLDRFDTHYLHLFTWDAGARRVVGAYRLGRTDRIVAEQGVEGLYTRTLFRYDRPFIDRLSPALELGRSFVRAEYQRSHSALLLLWRGIGQWLGRHPEYRVLFGPVTISRRYSDLSHALLKTYLERHHLDGPLSDLVESCHPLSNADFPVQVSLPDSVDAVDRQISTTEDDGKGVPVLLRQYLKLNARVVGFSVDPDFGHALDALMMVDLRLVRPALLSRFLGPDAADALRRAAA